MPQKTVAEFSLAYLQVLSKDGKVDKSLDPNLSKDALLKLYRSMVFSREADLKMLNLQRQGRLGTFPPSTGQEASFCGAAFAMGEKDWFVGTYRELGARVLRGESFLQILRYYNGYEEGSDTPVTKRVLPTQVILGSQLPHAVGIAYAMNYTGEKNTAVVSFFGDGASSQGDVHEAMNFAGTWKAPVVFICQNNGWAISVPRETQSAAKTLAQRAFGYGIEGIQVDGNDALAVYKATKEALERAYAGKGPTFIEAVTYRMMMHTTADDPKKYRDEKEVEQWKVKDPIVRFKKYLEDKGILNETSQEKMLADIKKEIDQEVKAFEKPGDYKPDKPFDHVFATQHESIEEQRREFLENLRKDAGDGKA